jgi:hypothetical protein
MQAWDYLTVSARWGGVGNLLRPKMVNGNTLAEWEAGLPLGDYICGLGEQGWELVSEWYDPNSNTAAGVCWQYSWLWTDEAWQKVLIDGRTYEGMAGYLSISPKWVKIDGNLCRQLHNHLASLIRIRNYTAHRRSTLANGC